ncbi:MAG: hypothetical protein IPH31_12650 [Lewinellaceae bacterium]|nr:hypothetical protein [Lewinellaceae bacterium]
MLPPLPPPFIRQMEALLGTEWPLLEAALHTPPPVSIRLNPRKTLDNGQWTLDSINPPIHQSPLPAVAFPPAEPWRAGAKEGHQSPLPAVAFAKEGVPWHPQGHYLPERPIFTLDPTFHAGAYYVQEASSMFIYEALRQTVDFSKPLKVLDL